MQLAHKTELKTNNKQVTYFRKACGVSRFCWNWGLAAWNQQYDAGLKPSGFKLKKEFNATKKHEFPWMFEVTKYAAQQPFLDLQDAFSRFFRKEAQRPKFKKKNKSQDSFYIGGDQLKVEGRRLWVPNLGWVRMREELRLKGKINSAVISRSADRWFVAIQVDAEVQVQQHENQVSVGIDLGIQNLATFSSGVAFEAPKPLKTLLQRLKRQSRVLSRKTTGSRNFRKQSQRLGRLHFRIANKRRDTLHKITSWVTSHYSDVGVENLNVRGMLANRKLSRAISDLGFYEFRRQLKYKLALRGGRITLHDPFFPSSKKCSQCHAIKAELSLKEREFQCSCGFKLNRDLNAAINLNPIPEVSRELTPVEMTALKKQVGLVYSTSIAESGNKHQWLYG